MSEFWDVKRCFLYLRKCILAQLSPIAGLSSDDNKLACEKSFFQTSVHTPPFCIVTRYDFADSAGGRDSRYSQIKCRWLDAASSSIFFTFSTFKPSLHYDFLKFLQFMKKFSLCTQHSIVENLKHTVSTSAHIRWRWWWWSCIRTHVYIRTHTPVFCVDKKFSMLEKHSSWCCNRMNLCIQKFFTWHIYTYVEFSIVQPKNHMYA